MTLRNQSAPISSDTTAILTRTGATDVSLLAAVGDELHRARERYPNMASPHEGYAVIKEELDEYWEATRRKPSERDPEEMRRELIQVAAMAIRTATDCTGAS